jgi:DNA polymerase
VSDVREDVLLLVRDLQTELRVLRGLGVRVVKRQAQPESQPGEPSVKKPENAAPKIGGRKTTYQFGDGRQARWEMVMQEREAKPTKAPKGRQAQLFGQGARAEESLAQAPSKPVWQPNPLSAEEVQAKLDELRQEIGDCTRCRLHTGRNNLVFGAGSPKATLLFAGEGPGRDEDRTGKPFVGRAGHLLDKIIEAMGLKREDTYICNVIKCRPPENRTPQDDEMRTCGIFLARQIEIIRPRHIVCLGSTAAKYLLQINQAMGKIRGRFFEHSSGARILPTYHPAYLLRNAKAKKLVWEDLQKVMGEIKQPVEEDPNPPPVPLRSGLTS